MVCVLPELVIPYVNTRALFLQQMKSCTVGFMHWTKKSDWLVYSSKMRVKENLLLVIWRWGEWGLERWWWLY